VRVCHALQFLVAVACVAAVAGVAIAKPHPTLDVLAWIPGAARGDVEDDLTLAGYRPIGRGANALLLVTPVFSDLFAQQRTLVEFDDRAALATVSVHLVPERDDAGDALMDLYEATRRSLVVRLGAPTWSREEGRAVRGQILAALAEGRIVRCLQWDEEWTVRLGIPRTASGEARVEVLLVHGELPAAESYWGRDF
jgi:hypothetical protein